MMLLQYPIPSHDIFLDIKFVVYHYENFIVDFGDDVVIRFSHDSGKCKSGKHCGIFGLSNPEFIKAQAKKSYLNAEFIISLIYYINSKYLCQFDDTSIIAKYIDLPNLIKAHNDNTKFTLFGFECYLERELARLWVDNGLYLSIIPPAVDYKTEIRKLSKEWKSDPSSVHYLQSYVNDKILTINDLRRAYILHNYARLAGPVIKKYMAGANMKSVNYSLEIYYNLWS
jgi:hypothetical protein